MNFMNLFRHEVLTDSETRSRGAAAAVSVSYLLQFELINKGSQRVKWSIKGCVVGWGPSYGLVP